MKTKKKSQLDQYLCIIMMMILSIAFLPNVQMAESKAVLNEVEVMDNSIDSLVCQGNGPGDCNNSGEVDVNDVIAILDYLFSGGANCTFNGDANIDGTVNISDPIFILNNCI